MKKYIILLSLGLIFALNSTAQNKRSITLYSSTYGNAIDTVAGNSTPIYFVSAEGNTMISRSGKYVVTFLKTEISGTSSINVVLQGSNDGTNWFRLTGASGTDGVNCDTIAVPDATGATAYRFSVWPGGYKYLPSATYAQTIFTSGACYVPYLRVAFNGVGATQSTKIENVKLSSTD